MISHILEGAAIGIGATALIDAWNTLLKRGFGVSSLDYCLLGRWVGHLRHSVVRHHRIATSPRIPRECLLGWLAHYAIGAGLAIAFVAATPGWLDQPSASVAFAYGIGTVVFPFFVLQPALGLGVASSSAPRPALARLKSLATHGIYGLGLFAWAWVLPR